MRSNGGGFTLVELLIVLAILLALSTFAITATGDLTDRMRYDETDRRGDSIARTVNGDGSAASRFVGDMGRLPRIVSTDEGEILSELFLEGEVDAAVLWDGSAVYDTADAGNDWPETGGDWSELPAQIALPCGWRGPYMVLNDDTFYDGWGHPWQVDTDTSDATAWGDYTTVAPDDPVDGVRSLGRDNAAGGAEWMNEELVYPFEDPLVKADLTVEILYWDGAAWVPVDNTVMDYLRVSIFAPYVRRTALDVKRVMASRENETAQEGVEIDPAADADYPHLEGASWEAYHRVTFSAVAPGPRKLYAYGYDSGGPPGPPGPRNQRGSTVLHVDLKPGSNSLTVHLVEDLTP
jgi:prepilin-type N-terminal cleavage/methylation domain-containing protein